MADRAAANARETLVNAHCIESFSVLVHGGTKPTGEQAVILGLVPPGERGWTFPLPLAEARRIAGLMVEVADRYEARRG